MWVRIRIRIRDTAMYRSFKFFFRFPEVRKNGGGGPGADGGGRSGLPGGHSVRQGDTLRSLVSSRE
jgi:hypothetical protein